MITMTLAQSRRNECTLWLSCWGPVVVELKPMEARLLEYLLLRRPCVVRAEEVIEYVWPDPDREPDYALKCLYNTVTRLRTRIGPRLVVTVVGIGWRLLPDVAP